MKLKYIFNNEYLILERATFAVIRRYILHASKKYIAKVCGMDEATIRRTERQNCKIRKSTFETVLKYYHKALILRGWKVVHTSV